MPDPDRPESRDAPPSGSADRWTFLAYLLAVALALTLGAVA